MLTKIPALLFTLIYTSIQLISVFIVVVVLYYVLSWDTSYALSQNIAHFSFGLTVAFVALLLTIYRTNWLGTKNPLKKHTDILFGNKVHALKADNMMVVLSSAMVVSFYGLTYLDGLFGNVWTQFFFYEWVFSPQDILFVIAHLYPSAMLLLVLTLPVGYAFWKLLYPFYPPRYRSRIGLFLTVELIVIALVFIDIFFGLPLGAVEAFIESSVGNFLLEYLFGPGLFAVNVAILFPLSEIRKKLFGAV